MMRLVWLIGVALGIVGSGWFLPPSASALSFFKELVSEEAIPNAELKIDSQGNIHGVFLTKNTGEIKYAKKSQNLWTIEGLGIAAQWVALAIDTQDQSHIAFYDPASSQIKYARKTPDGVWNILPVAPAYNSQCRIATYGIEQVYIAYNSNANNESRGRIYLALIDAVDPVVGSVKSIEEIDAGGDVGYWPALVLDTAGRPHLTYYDNKLEKLKYAFKSSGVWQISLVDSALMAGWQSALALDAGGWPHVAYYDYLKGDLKYAYKNAWGWHRSTIDSTGTVGQYPALAFDPRGRLFFAYYDATLRDLKIAYKEGFIWKKVALVQDGDSGYHISLVINNMGESCLFYFDYDSVFSSTKLYYGVVTLPRVYLSLPLGGEVWPSGTTQTISWRASSPEILSYKVQYTTGFIWIALANNLPADQREYRWLVPPQSMVKNKCRIKISGIGAGGKILATDQSPYFTLTP